MFRKSQIAIEYAYRYHEKYPEASVFWVYASTASRFNQDYLQIGTRVKLPGIDDPNQDTNQLVRSWLSSKDSGTWLMVIDNADDADLFFGPAESAGRKRLCDYVPQCSDGSILFTTRNRKVAIKFAAVNGVVSLRRMERIDSEKLFRTRSGDITSDRDSVTELLEVLDNLPLAITQAASYMAENSTTVREYLQLYNESEASRIELLSENFEDLARDEGTRNPVAATWVISFDQIRRSSAPAANLLSFMACLDRRGIPKDLLPPCGSVVELSNAIGLLKAYSFITATQRDTVFDMHRLVYLAMRNWLRLTDEFDAWAQSCLTTLSAKYPTGEYEVWSTCQLYLPHARAVLAYEQLSPANDDLRAELASRMLRYLFSLGNYNDGETLATVGLAWSISAHGEQNLTTLGFMVNLARCFNARGKGKAAEELTRRALNMYERLLGENWDEHGDVLICMDILSNSCRNQGRYGEAKDLQLRTLEIAKRTFGEEHDGTLVHMANLASIYYTLGSHEVAQDLNLGVLKMKRRRLGEEHPDTLRTMANVALSYSQTGKPEEAEALQTRVLEISKRVLGEMSPMTLAIMSNLACTYRVLNRRHEADELQMVVLRSMKEVLGREHPETLGVMADLTYSYGNQGRWDDAEELGSEVLARRAKVVGEAHP